MAQIRNYTGSVSCSQCHMDIYEQWRLTPHARMARKTENEELKQEIPFEQLGWDKEQIEWVLGSHYVNRFVARASETLVVLPNIWDRHEKRWLPVTDKNWQKRYWLKECAGCHTTGFLAVDDSFVEAGVGCEACHGPGSIHIETTSYEDIVSQKRLTEHQQEMICMSCHTSGFDNSGTYHFPVGFLPGEDLTKYFSGLTPKPDQTYENFLGDETYEDRERQWQFLKNRHLLASGLTCGYCQNFRDISNGSSLYMTKDQYCLTCHTDYYDHPEQDPGKNCIICHIPELNRNNTYSVHDHRFFYEKPIGP